MATNEMYELKREGHGHTYEMARANLTTPNIALVFGLDPKTIWLKEPNGTRCYFPVGESFPTMSEFSYCLLVNGTPPTTATAERGTSFSATEVQASSSGSSASSQSPTYKGLGGGGRNCVVKVIMADKNVTQSGKIEFKSIDQMYIDVSPSNANIEYIRSQVQAKWGAEYHVVSNDGLKIGDSAATRGIKFWKVGSRKIFAVKEKSKNLKGKGKKRKKRCSSSEEEEESELMKTITSIDKKVTKVLDVNPHLPLPLGISTLLYETFKCSICLISPLVPPVIVSACCGHIVGCQKCTDSWYKDGDTLMKPCPLCGRERGYNNSLLLYGVNDLLLAIAGMASPSGSQPVRTPIVPAPPAALDLDSTDLSE